MCAWGTVSARSASSFYSVNPVVLKGLRMHHINKTLGSTAALADSQPVPNQPLHIPLTSGMGSTRRHTAAQRELYGGLSDLLGGTDDWDMEEEENDRGEGGGKVREKLEDATKLKSTPSTQDEKAKSPVAREIRGKESVTQSRGVIDRGRPQSVSELSELDDMDASLFGSFSRSQSKTGGKKTKPSDSTKEIQSVSSSSTLVDQKESVPLRRSTSPALAATSSASADWENLNSDSLSMGVHQSSLIRTSTTTKSQTKDIDDFGLLTLLADEAEERTRARPKFRMKPISSRQSAPDIATSIDSESRHTMEPQQEKQLEQVRMSGETEERPKSRKGCVPLPERLTTTTTSTATSNSSGPDILTLDDLTGNGGENTMVRTKIGGKVEGGRERVGGRGSHAGSGVDFEGEDDILSGMGLDDSSTPRRAGRFDFCSQKKPSRVTEPQDQSSPQTTDGGAATNKGPEAESRKDKGSKEDEESYVFGGYLPSVVSGTRRVGLPVSEGRSGRALEAGFHSTRHEASQIVKEPGSIRKQQPVAEQQKHSPDESMGPGSKKSVRFADEVESGTERSSATATATSQPDSDNTHKHVLSKQRVSGEMREEREAGNDALSEVETERQLLQAKIPYVGEDDRSKTVKQSEPEGRLEHPVFPWQQRKRDRGLVGQDHIVTNPKLTSERRTSAPVSEPSWEVEGKQSAVTSAGGVLSSREQTLPERQSKRERRKGSEEAGLNLKNLETDLQREKIQNSDLKARVTSLQQKLEASEQQQHSLAEKLQEEKMKLQSGLQSKELELASQLEEVKAKLHRVELERDQLQHSLEAIKTRHAEEQEMVEKSHSDRVQALEESYHRRETKWREELEEEASRQKEKLEQLERDKTDSVLALKKKIESLEIAKTNELSQLQETHRSAVADLKREHELDLHRVKGLHRQEVEALKATHSHTQRLSELSGLIEEATRGVSGLQSRVDQAHRQGLEDSQHNSQIHQQQVKTLEERLSKQYRDLESERELLRSLAGRLETHLCQQSQAVETEKWSVQQERVRLRAGERALQEERNSSLARLEEERRSLAESKEKFLAEQQKLLSECLSERHSLATERAQLTELQRKVAEAEKSMTQRRQEMEVGLEATLAKAKEGQAQIATEAAHLRQEDSRLKTESSLVGQEREAVERDRASLLEQRTQIKLREEEANKLSQSAAALYKEGEDVMQAARRVQAELAEQVEALKAEREHIQQRESQLASERLAFACECRELQERQSSPDSLLHVPEPILTSTQRSDSHSLPPTPPLPDVSTLTHSLPVRLESSLNHTHQQPVKGAHSALSSLHKSRQLRNMAWDTKKDDLALEEEREFLESVHHHNSLLLSDHYSRLHSVKD